MFGGNSKIKIEKFTTQNKMGNYFIGNTRYTVRIF